jgi:UDP-N-acetyl-2-amino-2-deoxyglucuronate dehydrogenase
MSRQRVAVGIAGAGRIADLHAQAYRSQPRPVELMAVADLNSARAREFAARWGIPRVYTSVGDMLESAPLEAVDICLPTGEHRAAVLAAMERGLHVLCEKPLAPTSEDCRELGAASVRQGVVLLPGHNRVHFAAIRRARRLITEGTLGTPQVLRATFLHAYHPLAQQARTGVLNWRGVRSVAGGGAVLESGIHHLYTAEHLLGPVASVMATVSGSRGLDIEDSGAIVLEFASGARGVLTVLWGSAFVDDGLSIVGTGGMVRISGVEWRSWAEPTMGVFYAEDGHWEFPRDDSSWEQSFRDQAEHFLACIAGEQEPLVTVDDATRAVLLVESIYRSSETGCRVRVPKGV